MLNVAEDRQRLADAVKRRRLALGLSERAASLQAPVARNTWTGLETGTRRTSAHYYAAIERVLQWEPGSIERVLAGQDPIEMERPVMTQAELDLVEEIKQIEGMTHLNAATRRAAIRALINLQDEEAAQVLDRDQRAG